MATPARHAVPPQQLHERNFRLLVAARTDARHDFRSLLLGEDVAHSGPFAA